MIDPKELRIGNLLQPVESFKWPLKEIGVDFICLGDIGIPEELLINDFKVDQLEPIPLTEEWLIRFGFKFSGRRYDKHDFPSYVFADGVYSVFAYDENNFMPDLKFVHQLQNLYFALTGEELTYRVEQSASPTRVNENSVGNGQRNNQD